MSNLKPEWKNYKRSLVSEQSPPVLDAIEHVESGRRKTLFKSGLALVLLVLILYWSLPRDLDFNISKLIPGDITLSSTTSNEGPYLYLLQPEIPLEAYSDSLGISEKATIQTTITQNQVLGGLLSDLGFSNEMIRPIDEALVSLKEELNGKSLLKAGAKVGITYDLKQGIEELVTELDSSSELKITRQSEGIYRARISPFTSITKERIVVGSIESSFAASASKQGLSYDMVDDLVDIFSDRVSFHRDFRKGDRFTLIFHEHEVKDGGKTVPGPILGAALEVKGQHLIALRYVGADGKARYFNEKGQEIGNTFLRYPLKFSRISSYFSTARFHPVLKIKRPHHGVDFSAPKGTPVRTVASGVVEFAGRKGGHGIILEIRHSDRFTTGYSHLSKISSGLKRGSRVNKGDVIGAVGMTGLATGPHLHFSLYDKGKYVDPLRTDLPLADDLGHANKIDERYLKRALFTFEHFQNVANSTMLSQ